MTDPVTCAETARIFTERRRQPELDGRPFPWQVINTTVHHGPDELTTVSFDVIVTGRVVIEPAPGVAE